MPWITLQSEPSLSMLLGESGVVVVLVVEIAALLLVAPNDFSMMSDNPLEFTRDDAVGGRMVWSEGKNAFLHDVGEGCGVRIGGNLASGIISIAC